MDKNVVISLMEYVLDANEKVVINMEKDTDYMRGVEFGIESVLRDLRKMIDILKEG